MIRPRWRLRPLLFAAFAALLVVLLLVAERTAEFAVRRAASGTPQALPDALVGLRIGFLALGILGLVLTLGLVALLGGRIVGQLRAVRTQASERLRDRRAVTPRGDVAEVQAVAGAVDLLATELEKRSDALAVERDELALLLSSVTEGILQVDADARIVHANPAARMLLGLRSAPRGQPVGAVIRHQDLREIIGRAAGGADVGVHEIGLDDRRLLVAARPVSGGTDPEQAGAVVAFTDLTEIRRLEGVRRDFVANVSHELKTPLTSIRGYVETLLSDELPGDMQRQFLEVIHKNAERLHGIVDDLLDLSRLESGGWRPELRSLDAIDIVHDVWTSVRDRVSARSIEFATLGEPVAVMADPAGLRQVLSNLFDNAIRYTPDGGRITVRITSTTQGPRPRAEDDVPAAPPASSGWILFEIQDTGSGIPRDALPRIFERFYRVDPARSRAEGGTGLGLSIVRHLVESMDGEVTAESELGKGTLIRVRLPAPA